MKKIILALFTVLILLAGQGKANATILISSGSEWNYSALSGNPFVYYQGWYTNQEINWNTVSYNSVDWENIDWQTGNAPFGDDAWQITPVTYWQGSDPLVDLALQKDIYIDGYVTNLHINVGIDDMFAMFVNGHKVAQTYNLQPAWRWNESLDISNEYFTYGKNTISIIANNDSGTGSCFDMELLGNIFPAPEPSSMILGIMGIGSMLGFRRKKSA